MAMAVGEAAGRYGHVLLPGNLHAPVVQLSRYLLERGPGKGWADRAFYSDNGASAMEIALKMGLRLGYVRRRTVLQATRGAEVGDKTIEQLQREAESGKEILVLGQRGGYHGDTLAAMDCCEPSVLTNELQHPWYRPKVVTIDMPYISFKRGLPVIDASTMTDKVMLIALFLCRSTLTRSLVAYIRYLSSYSSCSGESCGG